MHHQPAHIDRRHSPHRRLAWPEPVADLLIRNARLLATIDADRRELAGGWVAIDGGLISAVGVVRRGRTGTPPRRSTPTECLVTPGLINTHHHMFQNLTRAYPPMTDKPLFGWLQSLYPLWRAHRHRGRVRQCLRRVSPSWPSAAARHRATTCTCIPATPATCCRRRSPPPRSSACASTRPAARCR